MAPDPKLPVPISDDHPVLVGARERLKSWNNRHRTWNAIYYGVSVGATGLTLFTAALPALIEYEDHPALGSWLSLVAALLVAFVAFSVPSKQARAYRAAWRLLDANLRAFELERSERGLRAVHRAIEEGERILAGRDPE